MARQGGFLVGPSIHGTSKLQKHKLKRVLLEILMLQQELT